MKYSRLIIGVVILVSMVIFMGSSPSHESEACFDFCEGIGVTDWGFIEVWNDTAFHIGVILAYSKTSYESYTIKHDPGMIRRGFQSGKVRVLTYIIDPILRTWKYHQTYRVTVGAGDNRVIRVKGGSLL